MPKFMQYMKSDEWYRVCELYAIQYNDCGTSFEWDIFYQNIITPLLVKNKLRKTYQYPIRIQRPASTLEKIKTKMEDYFNYGVL